MEWRTDARDKNILDTGTSFKEILGFGVINSDVFFDFFLICKNTKNKLIPN